MKNLRCDVLTLTLAIMMLLSTIAVFRANALPTAAWQGYVKPSFPDYAPSGMPDFDEKQDLWGPVQGMYTWCGPVAVANSLWWLDSEYESLFNPGVPVPPPTVSDHFNLVPAFGPWDDHSPQNVDPLVHMLAFLMDTDGQQTHDGHLGTRWQDLENGTKYYIAQQGLTKYFDVHNQTFPYFNWISNETLMCQDVELFLEFYQYTPQGWNPLTSIPSLEAGHFVTCAGVNTTTNTLLISDPYQDAYEAGTAPGRSPSPHLFPHNSAIHNDTQYVSQDAYSVANYTFIGSPPPPPPPMPPPGYPAVALELQGYLQTMGLDPTWHTFIRAAVATSPKAVPEWPGYVKPAFPDYAPSGMPDIDEKQDQFTTAQGQYTWCVPVSVANSLWWLDSKYESIMFHNPVPPPTISDHFNLVTSYSAGQWDDHDPNNVAGLVANLAVLMDTDGIHSGDLHIGTRLTDIQNGIQQYLAQQGVAGMFEVHNQTFANFTWIASETEKCQDVEVCLEFWQLTPQGWGQTITNPTLEFGHCVTSAGVNSTASQLLISDPYQDAYEAGTAPGRSPSPHLFPHNSAIHNDAQYVSQDAYSVGPFAFPPVPPPPPGYPSTVWELQGYLQTMGFDPSYHAFIRAAFAVSPLETHDIALTNLTTCKDGCTPMPVVCRNFTAHVNVTVLNEGNVAENVSVTAYANTTVIGTQSVLNLDPLNQTVVTFLWNTTGYAIVNYTLSAYATPVPGEVHTVDNVYNYTGFVRVTIVGDINGDDKCDMRDVGGTARGFGSTPGLPGWNPNADLTDDHQIDMKDIGTVARHFGENA